MNVFTFTGNLGRDAESRRTQKGDAVANFNVAVKSGYGDREKTTWVRCVLFGKRAEGKLIDYLTKGTQVAVSGELSLDEFDKKDGSKSYSLECNVREIDLIGGRDNGGSSDTDASVGDTTGAALNDSIPFAAEWR